MEFAPPGIHSPVLRRSRRVRRGARLLVAVVLVLDAGAYAKARDHRGVTPLHIAADSCRSPAVIAMLLDAGADPKARVRSGRTPWDFVRMNCGHGGTDAYRRLRDARTQ